MFPAALERVLALPEQARVLDVGGWAAPVNRADWVIDAMPYETRGVMLPGGFGPPPERFSAETWLIADLCGSDPWPFEDDFFDFAICTFTLEDLRDPIRTCEEMSRVARAGYIEVPTVLDELQWMNPEAGGGRWLGHSHHRWLCSLQDGVLTFLPKHHSIHAHREVRVSARWGLSEQDRVLAHFWEGSLPARERMAIDDYPFAELERIVRDRFGPMPASWRAIAFLERARSYARWRLASARSRRDGADAE